jgi:hypothetical protein
MEFNIKKQNGHLVAYDLVDTKKSYGKISLKTGKFVGNTNCLIDLTNYRDNWVEVEFENTYTPQLINVIEIINGVVSQVHSYLVKSKEEESIQSRNAETLFLQLVNENTKPIEPLTEDDVDFDSFDDQNGYEIITNWGVLHSLK